jgi:RNA polymerase sigma factor (sigma-70 family)
MTSGHLAVLLRQLRSFAGVREAAALGDRHLLERFTRGRDEAAFAELLRRHGGMVWGVCRRVLADSADADDAFQATFLVLLHKAATLRGRNSLAGWLQGVAWRLARKLKAEAARRRLKEGRAARKCESDFTEEMDRRDLRALLDEELDRLPEKYRAPLVLCYLEGLSYTEAARQLGWRDGTVCGRLARARELLRQRLSRRGLTLSGAALIAALTEPASAPAATMAAATRMAALFALGQTVAGSVSPPVATLAQGVLQAMHVAKLKTIATLVVALGLLVAGAGLAAPRFLTRKTPEPALASNDQPEQPRSAKAERTDLYDDPLPPGAVMRLGTLRLRHASGVAVAFSKDGKHLISCGMGGEVRVWDTATGKRVRRTRLAGKARDYILHAGLSLAAGGATASAWDGNTTYLYDTATGQERGRLPNAQPLAFSPDGTTIAVQVLDKEKNGLVQLWDIARLQKHLSLDVPPRTVLETAVFAPDGKQMAALGREGRKELFVWDAVTGKLKQRTKFRAAMASLAYAPDGATLAAGLYGRSEAALFDAATLQEKAALPARANVKVDRFTSISLTGFSRDGRLLIGGCYTDGYPLQEQGFLIWDLSGSKGPRWLPTPSFITASTLAPDGKTLACFTHIQYGGGNAIDLWDVASGRRLHQLPGHDTPVGKLAVSPDGKILASSDYKPALRLWDTATGKPLRSLAGWDGFASDCLVFSADSQRFISVSRKGKLQIWDVATGKELCRFAINSPGEGVYPGYTVALFGGGQRLAAVTGLFSTELSIWDAATGKQLNRRPLSAVQPTPSRGHVELAPDGESATVWSSNDQLTIEDISTKALLATLPKGVGHPLAFSADGRLLAVFLQPRNEHGGWVDLNPISEKYDVKGLSLIETASGQEAVRLNIRRFDSVAFTPDGRALVVTDKQKLSVWDAATGERLHQMAWPESVRDERGDAKISSLVVLPDGRAATGMTEGEILIWDLAPSTWPVHPPVRELSRAQFDVLWSELARDARTAYRAASLLAASPAWSVPLLGAHLQPVAADSKHIEKLLADLDDERFAVRDRAARELESMGPQIGPALRRVLASKPSLEVRNRVRAIQEKLHGVPPAAMLRALRAIRALEQMGTREARELLRRLAGGAAEARESREAKAALQRLTSRPSTRH